MNRMEWWIDYLEDESTPTEQQDMQLLLENSNDHRAIFEGLKATRLSIKSLDPVRSPGGQEFYNSMHLSIMSRLDEELSSEGDARQRVANSHLSPKAPVKA